MTAKYFADSNIVLYTIGKDVAKSDLARNILAGRPAISVQVVNECISVCLRKLSFPREQAYAFGRIVMDRTEVFPLEEATLDHAASLAIRYQLAHWDARILASALLASCETLYSEDFQHGQIFESRLKVINPFVSTV